MELLKEHRIPAAPVNDFAHALEDIQIIERKMVVDVPLKNGQTVQQPGNPIKMSAATEQTFTAPPDLGQHTAEIMQQLLKLSPQQIRELTENGVIA